MGIKLADLSPERLEEHRRQLREKQKARRATPEGKAKRKEWNAKYRQKDTEKSKEQSRRYNKKWYDSYLEHARAKAKRNRDKNKATGQAAQRRRLVRNYTPKTARELIINISKRVPNYSCKDDIIAQSVLFVCEGARIYDAIKKATKVVLKEENFMQYAAVDIADCYWLEAEPETSEDASF